MLIKLQQSPTRNWSQRSQGVGRDPALGSRPRSIGKPIAKESPFIDTSFRTRKRVPNLWVTTPLWGHDPSMGSRPLRIHDPSKGSRPIYGVTTPLVSRLETLSNQIQWTIAYCRPFSNLLTRFCDGCGRNGNPTERVVEIWLRKDDVGSFFFSSFVWVSTRPARLRATTRPCRSSNGSSCSKCAPTIRKRCIRPRVILLHFFVYVYRFFFSTDFPLPVHFFFHHVGNSIPFGLTAIWLPSFQRVFNPFDLFLAICPSLWGFNHSKVSITWQENQN